MAVDHDSAGTSARPDSQTSDTITLTTDADFAAAETELLRLLTLQGQAADDGGSGRIAAWWLPIYGALIDATSTTPFQAAVVLRRLISARPPTQAPITPKASLVWSVSWQN